MIFSAAGRLGLAPQPFTWRQLDDMDHAKRKHDWQQTGDLAFVIASAAGAKGVTRNTFNRYEQQRIAAAPVATIKPSELINLG